MREENIVTISDYLRSSFRACRIKDEEIDDDHFFLVIAEEGDKEIHRLKVSEDFLDDTPPAETEEELERFDVASTLRGAGPGTVLLTPEGLENSD